jgi:hypothetical protein
MDQGPVTTRLFDVDTDDESEYETAADADADTDSYMMYGFTFVPLDMQILCTYRRLPRIHHQHYCNRPQTSLSPRM